MIKSKDSKVTERLPERTKSIRRPAKVESGNLLPKKRKWHQIRIDPLDTLFSKYIRLRDNKSCRKCGHYVGLTRGLHNAHYFGRSNQRTRFDEDNCVALCTGCHAYFHGHPFEFTNWTTQRLGETGFALLTARANSNHFKIDKEAIKLYLETKLNEL